MTIALPNSRWSVYLLLVCFYLVDIADEERKYTMIEFGREICSHMEAAARREWLVTNGIGGFAMGTVAGVLTRRYHGLLIAALTPPVGRTLMLTKLDEIVEYGGQYYPLYVNRWFGDVEEGPGVEEPAGHHNIERFWLDGTTPHWSFACGDAVVEKRVWMAQGENTTYIQYFLRRAQEPLKIYPKAFINYRDYHKTTIAEDWDTAVEPVPNGILITIDDESGTPTTPLYLLSTKGEIYPQFEWHEDYYLSLEDYRGQPDIVEDHLHIADFSITLAPGESVTIVASTKPNPLLNGDAAYMVQKAHEQAILAQAEAHHGTNLNESIRQLLLSADQFIVKRRLPDGTEGHSVIAGYPWFSDWGRDTMIALPGLTICHGRVPIAASILRTYAHFVSQGMIPNRFPDAGETPEYNTVDATLWYIHAIHSYIEATQDLTFLDELYPTLSDIIRHHQQGTRYSIKVDPNDGLLYAGETGVQLTWMDAKVDEWVVTPRTGKAVEINALWYNALNSMEHFAALLGKGADQLNYAGLALQVKNSFARFWYAQGGYCYDVIDGPDGHNSQLRPNQLLAVGLRASPLTATQQRQVVDQCNRHLITSFGLRSLAPSDPAYVGVYGGDPKKRDGSYHQGTTWGWLIGPFVAAHLRVYHDTAVARSYLQPALNLLNDHGLGSISEIFDGDAPFTPRGCTSQAWSVAEYLRVWQLVRQLENK
jgi:predicted glycogen debranching enzyme